MPKIRIAIARSRELCQFARARHPLLRLRHGYQPACSIPSWADSASKTWKSSRLSTSTPEKSAGRWKRRSSPSRITPRSFIAIFPASGVTVQMGEILDGVAPHMADYPPRLRFEPAKATAVDRGKSPAAKQEQRSWSIISRSAPNRPPPGMPRRVSPPA